MPKEIITLIARFIFTFFLFPTATVHTLIIAVPDANRPGAVTASILTALLIAMYDIGVFRVNFDTDYLDY